MERILRVPEDRQTDSSHGWWSRYERSLHSSSLSGIARSVVRADSRYILESGVFGAGVAGEVDWPGSRHRSGLVMGAVQSGKTASMLGVTALALDAGIDLVIVLAGTRVALWRQTYDRLLQQLRPSSGDLLFPTPAAMSSRDHGGAGPSDLYQVASARMRRALREQAPVFQ